MIQLARKLPVVVEVVRASDVLDAAEHNWTALPVWIRDAYNGQNLAGVRGLTFHPEGIDILTLEGVMEAKPSDWIIRGVKGELYPCRADIFDETYEMVPA